MGKDCRTLVLIATLAVTTSGCYKATFIRDPDVISGAEYEQWVPFFVFGLVGDPTIDVHQFCPDGRVALVRTGGNFGTELVGAITFGIYAPRKVYVTCAANAAGRISTLELTGDRNGKLVSAVKRVGHQELVAQVGPGAQPNSWRVSFAEVQP